MEREHTKLSAHTPPVGQAGEAVFTFAALPGDLVAMQALPEAALQTPAQTAALTVLALCAYAKDPEAGIAMLDWLRGPRPLTGMDRSFLRDRFRDGKSYLPFTYLEGATPENGYTPSQPFRIRVVANATSAAEAGYQKLFLPRQRREMAVMGAVSAHGSAPPQGRGSVGIKGRQVNPGGLACFFLIAARHG